MKKKSASIAVSLEVESFQLLRELQRSLADVLNSLGGTPAKGLFERFLFYGSGQINRAAEGFIALRGTGRVDAAKLLVRPAIELMFGQQAVLKRPELLYRMAYTERMKDRKWLRPVWARAGKDYAPEDQHQWQEFSRQYTKQYPNHAREDKEVKLYDVAKAANLGGYYDSHYRLYCQFTHGALRALVGALTFSDVEDSRTVAACVFSALEALNKGVGAHVPKLATLQQRLVDLLEHPPRQAGEPR